MTAVPATWIDLDPPVPMPRETRLVSLSMKSTSLIGIPRTCERIWAYTVWCPCPCESVPAMIFARPLGRISTDAYSSLNPREPAEIST